MQKKQIDAENIFLAKQKTAQSFSDHIDIATTFLKKDEIDNAQLWLDKAKALAKDYQQQSCIELEIKLLIAAGKIQQAWLLANQLFAKMPFFVGFQQLSEFKAKYQINDKHFLERIEQLFIDAYQTPNRAHYSSRDNSDLLDFYLYQKQVGKACDWAETHSVNVEILDNLADDIICVKPDKALDFHIKIVCIYIDRTHNDAYQLAIEQLKKAESALLPYPAQLERFYQQLSILAKTYKTKRNMLKLLIKHYANYL